MLAVRFHYLNFRSNSELNLFLGGKIFKKTVLRVNFLKKKFLLDYTIVLDIM